MGMQLFDRPRSFCTSVNIVESFVKLLAKADDLAVMRKSYRKESGKIIPIQFAQCRWPKIVRRHLPIISVVKFVTWQVMNFGSCQLSNFDTWQVSKCRIPKFDTCQVSNFRRPSPHLEKQTHILHAHRGEPAQPRQFDLQLVRQGVYCTAAPLRVARLLRDVATDKEVELQRLCVRATRRLRPRLKNGKLDVLDGKSKIIRQFVMRHIRIKNGDLCFVVITHAHLRFLKSRQSPCRARRSRPSPR